MNTLVVNIRYVLARAGPRQRSSVRRHYLVCKRRQEVFKTRSPNDRLVEMRNHLYSVIASLILEGAKFGLTRER